MADMTGLDKLLKDIAEKKSEDRRGSVMDAAVDEVAGLDDFIASAQPGAENEGIFPFRSPEDAKLAQQEMTPVTPVVNPEPAREIASVPVTPAEKIGADIAEKKIAEKKAEAVKPAPEKPKKESDLEAMLKQYEEKIAAARQSDKIQDVSKSVLDALAQFDIAGGPQFAGLKPIKTAMPEGKAESRAMMDMEKKRQLIKDEMAKQEAIRKAGLEERKVKAAELAAKAKEAKQSLNLTKGQEARDKEFAKEYAQFADAGGYSSVQKNLTQLDDVLTQLEKGDLTGAWYEKIPFMGEQAREDIRAIANEEGQFAQEKVAQVIQQSLRQTLGAQFTEKEGAGIIKRAFNPKAPPKENMSRLRREINQIKRMAQAKEAAGRHFEKYGTLANYEGPTNFTDMTSETKEPAQPETVLMQAPDGSQMRVRKEAVDKYIKKGAKIIK